MAVNTMKHPGGIQQANQGRMMAETDMAQATPANQGQGGGIAQMAQGQQASKAMMGA